MDLTPKRSKDGVRSDGALTQTVRPERALELDGAILQGFVTTSASGALARASISKMPPLPVPAPKFSVHSLLSRVAAAISVLNTRLFMTLPVST